MLREVGVNVLRNDTEITAHDHTAAGEAFEDIARHVDGNGETDALIAAATTDDGGVNADETAFHIHERATGVTGVDGGIGLDEIFVAIEAKPAATKRTDDAAGHGLPDAERIP